MRLTFPSDANVVQIEDEQYPPRKGPSLFDAIAFYVGHILREHGRLPEIEDDDEDGTVLGHVVNHMKKLKANGHLTDLPYLPK